MASCDVVVSDILAYDAGWNVRCRRRSLLVYTQYCGTLARFVLAAGELPSSRRAAAPPATRPLQQPDRVDVFSRFPPAFVQLNSLVGPGN